MVNGLRTLPPPEISSLGLVGPLGVLSNRQVESSSPLRVSLGSAIGVMKASGGGALARRSSSIFIDANVARERVCRRRRSSMVTFRCSGGSSGFTLVDPVEVETRVGLFEVDGRRDRMNATGEDDDEGWPCAWAWVKSQNSRILYFVR